MRLTFTVKFLVLMLASFLPACEPKFAASDGDDGDGDGDGELDAGSDANRPPVAVDDSAETQTEETVTIRLIDNDSDPDDDDLIISEVVQPENGFVEIVAGEIRVEYTSLAEFTGIDSFEYTVSDQQGGTDQAAVTVNVEEVPVLTLQITGPGDAESVEGPDVTISFEITGCNVSNPGADPEGCHVHRFVDGEAYEEDGEGALGWYSAADFDIGPLEAGQHELLLELITNAGSDMPVDPYVSDTVTFEVTIPPEK